jgi:hypothetical protein
MATVSISDTELVIKLSRAEKIWSLSGDLHIPGRGILGAWKADTKSLRKLGIRVGTGFPRLFLAGVWFRPKSRTFVLWRKGEELLGLNLTASRYQRIFIGVKDAQALAEQINDAITAC